MVGLTLLMIALGVAPALALMATDPLDGQSEVPPESPSRAADPSVSPLPPEDPPAEAPIRTEPDPDAVPPSTRPVVDLEWPEEPAAAMPDPTGWSAPVEPWAPPAAPETVTAAPEPEVPEGTDSVDDPKKAGREKAGRDVEPVEPAGRRCLLILCVG